VNHSGDPAQDALADRLTDAIISELARVPALDVRSRTTVMQYRHPRRPLRDVARELEARFIVEASVVRTGDTVTIAARLVNADADRKVWVNDFSGHASDVPELARRAATAIAAAAVRPTGPR
jgi:TolB-like protein